MNDYEDELLAYDQEDEAGDLEGGLDETGELELAAELLSVSDEQELDEFFSGLLRRARGFLQSPAGRRLKDLLRTTARNVLPAITQPVADFVDDSSVEAPPAAEPGPAEEPAVDGGEMFGIETEGLSPEDRDLEIARRLVRLAREAAWRLSGGAYGEPSADAHQALLGAADRHAPGLASYMRRRSPYRQRKRVPTGRRTRRPRTSIRTTEKENETMHDLDRTLRSQESEMESYEYESSIFGEMEGDYEGETYAISEEQENDLAAELLAVSDEQELDEFFRNLFKKAKGAIGPALKKYIVPLAKKALPLAATAVGGFFGGPVGAKIGGKIGNFATTLFETDFESMDPEMQDLEVAKHFIRFASAAADNAAATAGRGDPATVARNAVVNAAKVHAPGLLRPRGNRPGGGVSRSGGATSGRWVRRNGRIVLLGA